MEFRQLRAFVEVIRQGGFSHAARTVLATQSAVSKAVRQLENEIGTPLLDRIGHRSELTIAGEAVYRRGAKLLADRDDLLAELDEIRGLKRGVLRLGLSPLGSGALLAPLLAVYRQRCPKIEIRLIEHDSDYLEEILREGRMDFACLPLSASEDLDWESVRSEPLMAVLPANHRLAARPAISLADLRDAPFILFDSGADLQQTIVEACRNSGFEPNVVTRSSQIEFMIELVAAGLGVAVLPRLVASARWNVAVRHVLLEAPDMEWNMAIAWRRGTYLSDAAKMWLRLVREARGGPE